MRGLSFESVSKAYDGPAGRVAVLREVTFQIQPGDFAVVRGPSGCGKSTLLFTAGGMLRPDRGMVRFGAESLYDGPASRRHAFRGASVGFVFQRFHLIPYLTVAENILWPLRWSPSSVASAGRLPDLARRLDITHRLTHRPAQLSAGEQQRVAVARALVSAKPLICADEPTGNLDDRNAAVVMEALREEAARGGMVLLATHHPPPADAGAVTIDLARSPAVVE